MMRFLRILFMRLRQKAMTSSALMYSTTRFHFKKRDNSVPIPLLPCYLSTLGAGKQQGFFLPSHFASLTNKYLKDAK